MREEDRHVWSPSPVVLSALTEDSRGTIPEVLVVQSFLVEN